MATLDYLCREPEQIAADQFAKGLRARDEFSCVHIGASGVWSADLRSERPGTTGYCQSYEKIGYHAGTEWLVLGWLTSGVMIADHRSGDRTLDLRVRQTENSNFVVVAVVERVSRETVGLFGSEIAAVRYVLANGCVGRRFLIRKPSED